MAEPLSFLCFYCKLDFNQSRPGDKSILYSNHMRVVPVKPPRKPKRHTGRWVALSLLGVALLATITGTANYLRPLPVVEASGIAETRVAPAAVSLAWPSYGQASLALGDGTLLAVNGEQTPLATASIAKVITALCVLEKHPLQAGEQGPTITLTQADVDIYDHYVANDGSVAYVAAGEEITEYQLIEALMLPSANNLSDSLAIWAFGSLDAYFTYANQFLARNGMANTKVAVDASGLDSATVSTATDLTKLGSLALKQPVLMEIAQKKSTVLPVAGTVYNYNTILGQQGIRGLKTGNNDQNPGAFLFVADVPVGGKTVAVTGAVMGAATLGQALRDTVALVASVPQNFSSVTLATKDKPVATYRAPWGARATAVAANDLTATRWNNQLASVHTVLEAVDVKHQPKSVGTLYARTPKTNGQVAVVLEKPLAGPSFWWRLTRH